MILLFLFTTGGHGSNGQNSIIEHFVAEKLTCYFFFISDCPASRNNLPKVESIHQTFKDRGVRIIGVASDPKPDLQKLDQTLKEYRITFEVMIDSTLRTAKGHGATVTPQVFLYDQSGALVYSGLVDDYYESLGRHRKIVRTKFLEQSIRSFLADNKVEIAITKPIGCIINFDFLR